MESRQYFETIRADFCSKYEHVSSGKMMRSEAIHYKGKVFAFLSTKQYMVFRLGKGFNIEDVDTPLIPFSPFKNKKPMSGWFQLSPENKSLWEAWTNQALALIQQVL